MSKLSKEQLTNNVDLVKVVRKNEDGELLRDALRKAHFLTRASRPNNDEVGPSKSDYFLKHPEWSVLPYRLPDANIAIDVFVSNKSYRAIFAEDDDSKYYARVVNFEEMSMWNDMFNTFNGEMYVRIHGLSKDDNVMVIDVRSFIDVYNFVYPRHFYDMHNKNIGKTLDWEHMGVELYSGVLQVQKNRNVLFLNVWTVDRTIDVDKWQYANEILDELAAELESRGIHNVKVNAILNPSKAHVDELSRISEITVQAVTVAQQQAQPAVTDLQADALQIKKQVFKSEMTKMVITEILLVILGYVRLRLHQAPVVVALIIVIVFGTLGLFVGFVISKVKSNKAYKSYVNSHS